MKWKHMLSEALGNRVALGQLTLKQPQMSPVPSSGTMTSITGRKKSPVWYGQGCVSSCSTNWLWRAAHLPSTTGCCAGTQCSPCKAEQRETAQLRARRARQAPCAFKNGRTARDHWTKFLRTMQTYPGSKTPGVRQVGPEQDCNIIRR